MGEVSAEGVFYAGGRDTFDFSCSQELGDLIS